MSAEVPQLPPFDYVPEPYTGPSKEEVLAMRNEYLNPALFKYYRSPVMLVNGKMQVLYPFSFQEERKPQKTFLSDSFVVSPTKIH